MGSLNSNGSRISHSHRSSRKRERHVLVTDHTDDAVKKKAQEFNPAELDLTLWLNGSDTSKFTVNELDGKLTAWEATVGGVTFTSALAFSPRRSKLNGLHCPLFNPTGLTAAGTVSAVEGGMEVSGTNLLGPKFTLLAVARVQSLLGGAIWGLSDVGNNAVVAPLQVGSVSSAWTVQNSGSAAATGPLAGVGTTRLFGVIETGAARELWMDGSLGGTNSTAKSKAPMDAMQVGCLRVRADAQAFAFNGWIGEIIAINQDLTATASGLATFKALHRYLANKWGVALNPNMF